MDPTNMGGLPQSDGGQMTGLQQPQQQQGGGQANANFMNSALAQLQQQMGGGAPAGGAPQGGTGHAPLLVGATPLQQQLSALQGLTGGGQPGAQGNNGGGGEQTAPQGFQQALFAQAQGNPMQAQNQGMPQQHPHQQQQPHQGQMNQQNAAPLAGMMAQNPLFGGNIGFNVQQLQQLQFAQQLMAAGLPPQLAFGGGQGMMGLGLAHSPQLAALAGGNALGLAAQGGMGAAAAVPSGAVAVGVDATAHKPVGDGQEWAEPFSGKGKKEPPFPLKLHQILSNPEFQECICWNPHGRSWRILKPPVFEQLVIPLYFRHAKYASFMRQVNGWGFKRIVSGNDHNSYYHELFLRDYPQLCLKMKRIRKGDKVSDAKDGDGEEKSADDNLEDEAKEDKEETSDPVAPAKPVEAETTGQAGATPDGMMDNAALAKLQEALQVGGAGANPLQQQLTSSGLNGGNIGMLPAGLAAQLQAATQAPQHSDGGTDNGDTE